jgi:hypothetical protein
LPYLAKELENNIKSFLNHLSSILHGALVGVGSLWPLKSSEWTSGKVTMKVASKWVWIIKTMLFFLLVMRIWKAKT